MDKEQMEQGQEVLIEEQVGVTDNTNSIDVMMIKYKLDMLDMCEAYLADITAEIEFYASYIAMERQVEELKNLLDNAVIHEQQWKRQYNDLANSKLGRLQRFWWRITKKFFQRKG